MKTYFSQTEQQQIITDYQNGIDIDLIIKNNDTDEHYIRLILKENQIDRKYNTFTSELENRVIFLYQMNQLQKDIMYALLITGTGIQKILNRHNIPRMPYTIRNRKISRNSHYFDQIDTPNKAYILGLIYADGNNYYSNGHYMITIVLQEDDYSVLERIRNEIEYDNPLKYDKLSIRNPRHKNVYRLVINDEHMSKQLQILGVVQNKSLKISFPDYITSDLMSHFIRGYFDGDGCISYDFKRDKASTRLCGTYDFIYHVSSILHKLGIKNNIHHPKQSGNNNTFVMQTCGNKSTYDFLTWLYQDADIKMERKYNRYRDFCEKYNKQAA